MHVSNFEMFFSIRSGNDRRYPANIALCSDNISRKSRAPRRKFILSIEVNYWRFAFKSYFVSSIRFSKFITYISVIGYLLALRIG